MHFWIDKRSQACSLSGRYRAPPSSRHRGGVWGGAGTAGGGKAMVTPVHRFQPIECGQAGVRRIHIDGARRHRQQRPAVAVTSSVQCSGGVPLLPQGPSLPGQQQQLLAPRASNIKCALWASLTLITASLAAAKLYANNKGPEALYVMCALLLLLLLVSCILCSTRNHLSGRSDRTPNLNPVTPRGSGELLDVEIGSLQSIPSTSVQNTTTTTNTTSTPGSVTLAQHTQPWVQQQATSSEPPPYHIAIWLPQPEDNTHNVTPASQEVPPPSYDKATT